jgi:hypothetical protein
MEQGAVIRFFTFKRLKARAIHIELELMYGPESLALPTLKKWRSRFHQGKTDLLGDPRSGRCMTNDLPGAVGSILEEKPFSSCKVLCRHFPIGKATFLQFVHHRLGFRKFGLRGVLNALSINWKNKRVPYSGLLVLTLMKLNVSGFQ